MKGLMEQIDSISTKKKEILMNWTFQVHVVNFTWWFDWVLDVACWVDVPEGESLPACGVDELNPLLAPLSPPLVTMAGFD